MSDSSPANEKTGGGRTSSRWLSMAAVVLLFGLPLFVGLGRGDMRNDEAIYSFAVDVMLQTGDWLVPRSSPSEELPFLEKPPLKLWIVAAPIRLGLLPDNEFGLRFWDAVFGGVAFLYVCALGCRLGGPLAGVAAVLMLFLHRPLVFEHGLRSNNMEAALVLSYCGGLYHFSKWRTSEDNWRGRGHVLALALYFVLGFMTKFVAALFLPLVIGAAVLLDRTDRRRMAAWWRTWLAAVALAVVLIAPWFLYQYHRFGQGFLVDIFGDAVYRRFSSYLNPAHVEPWHFYFTAIWGELRASASAAWVLAGLLLVSWRTFRTRWPDGAAVLLWFALPCALISVGTSKLYHYAYPFLPPLALAAGYAVSVVWRLLMSLLPRIDGWSDRLLGSTARRVLGHAALARALIVVGALGCAVAFATIVLGSIRLAPWGFTLFRASAPGRALAMAILAFVLARRVASAKFVIAALVIGAALPIAEYRQDIGMLSTERHRLRSIRDCLKQVIDANPAPRDSAPVLVDAADVTHPAAFYLRTLGRWQLEDPSNEEIFSSLYVKPRPIFLGSARYMRFDQWLIDLQTTGGSRAGIDAAALAAARRASAFPIARVDGGLLLLPAPYDGCAF